MNAKTKRDELNDAITPRHFRTPFNYNPDKASLKTALHCKAPTRTQQHQKDETDINVIVQRFGVTGELPQARNLPTYGDFMGAGTYQESLNLVIQAQDAFNTLPANTRAHFRHDPAAFLAFIEAGPDAQLLLDLGLAHMTKAPNVSPKDETKPKDPPVKDPA